MASGLETQRVRSTVLNSYLAGHFIMLDLYFIIHSSLPFLVSNTNPVVLSETDASHWIKDLMRSKNNQLKSPDFVLSYQLWFSLDPVRRENATQYTKTLDCK